MRIERVTAGSVWIGESICSEDAEDLTNAEINEGWDAAEQDWQVVCDRRGHADVGQLLLQSYDGSRYWSPMGDWSQYVWRLVGDDGVPVMNEDVREAWRS